MQIDLIDNMPYKSKNYQEEADIMITAIATHHKLHLSAVKSKTTPEPTPTPLPNDTFGRKLHPEEIDKIIAGDQHALAKTCQLIHENVINVKDGALQQVYDLTGRYRSYMQWDVIRGLLEKKRDADVNLP